MNVKSISRSSLAAIALVALALLVGCNQQQSAQSPTTPAEPSAEGRKFLLNDEPADAQDVIKAYEDAKDEDEVAVVGRIGGSRNPWVKDSAAFTIVDPSLQACSDIEGDTCRTPWDYCCETPKLKTATALVKVVDDRGAVVATDARELLALKELQTVVVRGKAQRDEAGNLRILATGIHVRN